MMPVGPNSFGQLHLIVLNHNLIRPDLIRGSLESKFYYPPCLTLRALRLCESMGFFGIYTMISRRGAERAEVF